MSEGCATLEGMKRTKKCEFIASSGKNISVTAKEDAVSISCKGKFLKEEVTEAQGFMTNELHLQLGQMKARAKVKNPNVEEIHSDTLIFALIK